MTGPTRGGCAVLLIGAMVVLGAPGAAAAASTSGATRVATRGISVVPQSIGSRAVVVPAPVVRAAGIRAALPRGVVVRAALPGGVVPDGLVLPVRPVPTQAPSLGGVPCLPVLGCDPLGGLGADAANAMAKAVFDTFSKFVADGARLVLDQVSSAISDTTTVKLDRQWFQQHFDVMRSLALLVLLPLMLAGLMSAVIHRDAGQLLRAGGVYVPVAILGAAASILLTQQALQVTDWATTFVTGDLNGSVNRAMMALGSAVQTLGSSGIPGLGTFLAIVVLLVLMAGAVLIWIELLLRTSAIYVVVLFLPLAMSGLVWRATMAWTRRMVEALVALILSKFVIVVVLDLAAGMVTAGDGIGTIMQGATLLLLAACAPFALLRLVPMVEAGVIGHLERMERRPIAAAARATTAVARQVMLGAETAAAAKAVAGNGGDPADDLTKQREPGGQLNQVRVPGSGGSSGHEHSGRSESSPALSRPSGSGSSRPGPGPSGSGDGPSDPGPGPSGPGPSGPGPSGPRPSGLGPSGPGPSGPGPSGLGPRPSGPDPLGPGPSGPRPSGIGPGPGGQPLESVGEVAGGS